jgi:hypothetical protein
MQIDEGKFKSNFLHMAKDFELFFSSANTIPATQVYAV